MRICTIKTTGSLEETFTRARANCNPAFERAFNKSLDEAEMLSVGLAPVYNMSRWFGFSHFRHHLPPHGVLKSHIRTHAIHSHMNGRLFTGDIYAATTYANYVELGVWKHHLSHRTVRGKRFMTKAVNAAFTQRLEIHLQEAIVETFGGSE